MFSHMEESRFPVFGTGKAGGHHHPLFDWLSIQTTFGHLEATERIVATIMTHNQVAKSEEDIHDFHISQRKLGEPFGTS